MSCQHTLLRPVEITGIALHSGVESRVRLEPAPPGSGVILTEGGVNGSAVIVRARVDQVVDTRLATTLGLGRWRAATVEHLLAALYAERVDNVRVVIWGGGEVPALDGSAAPWVDLIAGAGLEAQDARRCLLVVRRPVEVQEPGRSARLLPCDGLELEAHIRFDHPLIGDQRLAVRLEDGAFRREVAWARTFGFLAEVEAMRAHGLARGGGLGNAIVYGPDRVLNPGGTRTPDEPVRHKLLDMIGDLALAGFAIRARFEAELPGHSLNARLVAALLHQRDCWELVEE